MERDYADREMKRLRSEVQATKASNGQLLQKLEAAERDVESAAAAAAAAAAASSGRDRVVISPAGSASSGRICLMDGSWQHS